jgi:hypothetical protein
MNIPKTPILSIAVCASLFAIGTPSFAAQGDATLEVAVAELRTVPPDRGEWTNRYMSHGTGRYSATSADEILTATLRIYTRQVLDRGGWVNAFVSNPGYDSGNPLLAARTGEGVTTVGGPSRFQVPQVVALATRAEASRTTGRTGRCAGEREAQLWHLTLHSDSAIGCYMAL